MTPKGRERAYEKRRYEEWQARLQAKQAKRRRIRQISLITAAAVAVVAVIGGGFLLLKPKQDDTTSAAATPSANASATPSAAASASASSTAQAAANPCPAVTVKPPAKPKQFAKAPPASDAGGKNWKLTLNTTCGKITAELAGVAAPHAVSAMILLAKSGFYNGSPCHRLLVEGDYILQCGDPTGTGNGGPGFKYGPVENAPKNNIYKAGTIAMARVGGDGNSMGSQFFLVFADSPFPADAAGGYTVLGHITSGLDVLKKVAGGGAGPADAHQNTPPLRPISLVSTSISAG